MKAIAVDPQRKTIRMIDREEPQLTSPTSVKLRMLEVGVCGTDREICALDYGTPPAGSDYLVIGHESLGEVVEVGPAVSVLRPGDLVVPTVRRPCRHAHCLSCATGRQDFCFTGDFQERGIKELHGFMTELVVDEQKYMNRLPNELRRVGVLVEPLTIAEKALMQVRQLQQRLPWTCALGARKNGKPHRCHSAVVLGAGPVGLLGAMALAKEGFETYVYSRTPMPNDRKALVESFGAHWVAAEEVAPGDLARAVGNIDLIYEAMGASQASFEAMRSLGTNGVFVFTGVPGRRGPAAIDTDTLMRNLVLKNQVVLGTVNAGGEAFEAAIADLASFVSEWPESIHGLITARHPMERYEELLLGRPSGIKNVLAIAG